MEAPVLAATHDGDAPAMNPLVEINRKLDEIAARLETLEGAHAEVNELRADFMRIGKGVYRSATRAMENIAPQFTSDDAAALAMQFMRSARAIEAWLDRLNGAEELLRELPPVVKGIYDAALARMAQAKARGYFDFFREALGIVDTIVTSFTVEDVRLLRENIAEILTTVKNLTQPEMLATADNALAFFRKMDIAVARDISYGAIFRTLRDPEVRRGVVYLLEFVKSLAAPNGAAHKSENS